ncbi:hypothetical protein PQR67_13505 [Paraburkholderia fungorum]|uniref:hypothetical protein n=1 Tax=Paraburkholderia fungorum TaxID=134537 RepID=UPI0038B97F90
MTDSKPLQACVDMLVQYSTAIDIPLEVNVSFAAFGSVAFSAWSARVSCCPTAV